MKIGLVVPGRFHAFDLAGALLQRGHTVKVLTNYPIWAARRFGVPQDSVWSLPVHGVLTRVSEALRRPALGEWWEQVGHRQFGRWAAAALSKESWDVIHCWSGVSEEILDSAAAASAFTLLMRGSAHIATQRRLLDEEAARAGVSLERPSDWIVARERREYARTDAIAVPSTFAQRSFEDEGVAPDRLRLLPLGVDLSAFQASDAVRAARANRIRRGGPLRVVYVGALSYQKGLADLMAAAALVDPARFAFRLVGRRLPETAAMLRQAPPHVSVAGTRPQAELPRVYEAADIFLFPTIQDGFALVLAQALAAGLPVITTPNSAGPDLVREGRSGWIVPIRSPHEMANRLMWCDRHRDELAALVTGTRRLPIRDWSAVAADFERLSQPAARAPLREAPADVA